MTHKIAIKLYKIILKQKVRQTENIYFLDMVEIIQKTKLLHYKRGVTGKY
jgi:hypothetical protein